MFFTFCADLDENIENSSIENEILSIGGEDEQDPSEDENPTNVR